MLEGEIAQPMKFGTGPATGEDAYQTPHRKGEPTLDHYSAIRGIIRLYRQLRDGQKPAVFR